MKQIAIVSILTGLSASVMVTSAIADYKKICLVSETLRLLDDDADANSCRAVAVQAQVKEYQIGCRDSEDEDVILITTPFNITDIAARVTSSKLAANMGNTSTLEKFAKCAKTWGSR
jgi:hypothetical protein